LLENKTLTKFHVNRFYTLKPQDCSSNSGLTGDAGDAVDEEEGHGAEGPGDAEDADATAAVRVQLALAPDDCVAIVT
jgi:hypothetical protein